MGSARHGAGKRRGASAIALRLRLWSPGVQAVTPGRQTFTGFIPHRVAQLLRLLRDPVVVARPRPVDPATAARYRLEAMESGPTRFAELRRRGVGRDLAARPPASP